MEMQSTKNTVKHNKDINTDTILEYIKVIRLNWIKILIITAVIFTATYIYSLSLDDIYKATTTLKISDPKGNVLKSPFPEFGGNFGVKDRFIANEIQTMYNITLRTMVAQTILDSIEQKEYKDGLNLVLAQEYPSSARKILSQNSIAGILATAVEINQPGGLDFIEITAQSPSPTEASLMANSYADAYRRFNLLDNRKQFANVKEFLKQQTQEKRNELIIAENNIKAYQLKGGAIELDKQASFLIGNLTEFEAKQNANKIEVSMIEERLSNLKRELNKRDPSLSSYLESKSTEPYLTMLQDQIAKVETQKDIFLANKSANKNPGAIKEYDATLKELKNKLKTSTDEYQKMILSSSPDEIKSLMQKIFEDEVEYQSLKASYNQINNVLNTYESKFNRLPDKALDLARLERERLSLEKLYSILEEKYQEALLNEQSTPGNILVLSNATPPNFPSDPNRLKISIIGLLIGLLISFTFVYIKSYFDSSIKSPDDITRKNLNLIGWIPKIKFDNGNNRELLVVKSPDSIPSEAFRTLRTRIQFTRVIKDAKIFLITSSAPNEGKTLISTNLAASFANTNTKVVVLDSDLRIPRVHTYFNEKKSPGFVDYFVGEASYEQIIRSTEHPYLYYVPAGKTPPNPSEILGSTRMKMFLQKLRNEFDLIILDSPPIMAVTDSEILLNLVDLSILVVNANSTKIEWMMESVNLLNNNNNNSFLGVLLNNFNYKSSGYRSSYSYYNYYSTSVKNKSNGKYVA